MGRARGDVSTDDTYVIGLTGNIATGKSLVLRMLNELGAYTIDADDLVHMLMRRGSPLYDKITIEFGRYVLDEDLEIDRGKLGDIVFCAPPALAHLERITHPTIKEATKRLVANARADVVAIEAIKLIESGMADDCDAVWVVSASEDVQLDRLIYKRNMSRPQAMLRIESQPPQEERMARASLVISNSGDVVETWKMVQRLFAAIPGVVAPLPEVSPFAPALAPVAAEEPIPTEALERVQVRRASGDDLPAIVAVMAQATEHRSVPDEAEMMERFFSKDYFVACADEQLLGLAGLRAEHLIATIDDCLVGSRDLWPTVGGALLETIEAEAHDLSCEVALLFAQKGPGPESLRVFKESGYQKQKTKDLIKMWRQVAEDYAGDGEVLWVKKLDEGQMTTSL
jgi:dephospho-CoA kinase